MTFLDTEELSQYGDNGTVSQGLSKQERDDGVSMPILGNVKIFYRAEASLGGQPGNPPRKAETQPNAFIDSDLDGDFPF